MLPKLCLLTCRAADQPGPELSRVTDSKQEQQYDNGDSLADDSWSTVKKKKQQNMSVQTQKPEMHVADWCSEPASIEDHATADIMLWHGVPHPPTHLQSTAAPWDAACNEQASWDNSAADSATTQSTSAWDVHSSAAVTCHNVRSAAVSLPPSAKQPTWHSSTCHDDEQCAKHNEDWCGLSAQGQGIAESDAGPDYSDYTCHFCQQQGHIQRFCRAYHAANAQPRPRKDFTLHRCHNCGQYGHVAYQCIGPGQTGFSALHHRRASHVPEEYPQQTEDWSEQGAQDQALAESDAGGPDYSDHTCHFCQQRGHIISCCPKFQAAQAMPRQKVDFSLQRCRNCGQFGHMQYRCPALSLVDHPALHHRAAPWNARNHDYAPHPQFARSRETHTLCTDQDLLSNHNQRYSDAQEPPARSAPASEGQQRPSAAPVAIEEPQPLLVPNRHDAFKDGTSSRGVHDPSRMAAQKEQDGWDTSTADPPFAALQMVLPPKPSPARRTPKITDPARHSSAQLNDVARSQDDMSTPEQHPAWQDSSQHAHPVTARSTSQGHPAFPEGIIQPAMGRAPPYSPPTGPVTGSPSVPLPQPRPQMQQQGSPDSHLVTVLRPLHRSFAGSKPSARGPRYEPHRYEQPAYRSSVAGRPHTQQGPSSSSMPDDRGFRPAVQQNFPLLRPAAIQSSTDFDDDVCNSLTPVRAAAEAARRASHDLIHDGVPGSPGIETCSMHLSHATVLHSGQRSAHPVTLMLLT